MQKVLDRPIFQYAWLVNDLEESARRWTKLFKAGPWFFNHHHRVEEYYRYRGGDIQTDVSYAFAYCGPVQIQLCQLHDDKPSIFREMYPNGGEGFHHVGVFAKDFAGDKQHMINEGLELALEMWGGADVCYLDARKQIGCFVEIHGYTKPIDEVFDLWKSSHESWDGVTDPFRQIDVVAVETAALPKK